MEDKIFDFAATRDALSELSTDLISLDEALKLKQNSLNAEKQNFVQQLHDKDTKIESLVAATQSALDEIEAVTHYIEEVL